MLAETWGPGSILREVGGGGVTGRFLGGVGKGWHERKKISRFQMSRPKVGISGCNRQNWMQSWHNSKMAYLFIWPIF